MAAVFWASLSRSAMRWRSRVIGTRSSRAPAGADFATGAGGDAGSEGTSAVAARWARTSPLVSRPPFPVPAIAAGSSPCSSTSLRTAGESDGGAAAGDASGRAGGGGAGAAFPSPGSIEPRTAPTSTVRPSATSMAPRTPAAAAGTSSVILSVSSSTRGSSTATASPADLSHLETVASVTDSPSAGTTIWVAIVPSLRRP